MRAEGTKTKPSTAFVEVVLPLPLRRAFTYRVPEKLRDGIVAGIRVVVPFGSKQLIGYAVRLLDKPPLEAHFDEKRIKDVIETLDTTPLLTEEILELTRWTAEYYASFWGELLKAALPAGINTGKVKAKFQKAARLMISHDEQEKLSQTQLHILDVLAANGGEMLLTELVEVSESSTSRVQTLAKHGFIELFDKNIVRDPLRNEPAHTTDDIKLSDEQKVALDSITSKLTPDHAYNAFLLHGVTGSGKTEVYTRAMREALEKGLSSIMLVPEVALTPVFARKLRAAFESKAAILHSKLAAGERFDEWTRIRNGEAKVVIGTRMSVFAPVDNLGLIIVDEEHDSSYRAQESPFYNARDVAVMRAKKAGAVVVLGSATPSLESYHNVKTGKYSLLRMAKRVGGQALADVQLIDMREAFRAAGKNVEISPELKQAILETHEKGEQIIILINRRGFSQFVFCRMCGESIKCKRCDIGMTYNRNSNKLVCHYCNATRDAPLKCPSCESQYLHYAGEGTEKIEDILAGQFPEMRIARVDRDTTQRKGEINAILTKFAKGKIDMLVGTQMVAKGHDFPNVTLVGVVSVDIGLGLPDFRSAERTFQLLTQVAGRAGRGTKTGRVLIQTYHPENYALRHAKNQDYEGFYREETGFREQFHYPPYSVLASIMIKHRVFAAARRNAELLYHALADANTAKHARILGPAQASLSRIKNEHRQQIILKGQTRRSLREMLDTALVNAESRGLDMRSVFVEIDPVNVL